MPSLRRKNLVARRRVDDEGEDDEGMDVIGADDSSVSEGSVSDDEGSQSSPLHSTSPQVLKTGLNGHATSSRKSGEEKSSTMVSTADILHTTTNGISDTDMMLNGLNISEDVGAGQAVDYEDMKVEINGRATSGAPPVVDSSAVMDQPQETPMDRRRREHEEYKQKRAADPAFVPNRGAFFMHDHRHAGPAANGFRPYGRGRGRGRGGMPGPFGPMRPQSEVTDAPWAHDMHETVNTMDNRPRYPTNNHPSYTDTVPRAPRGQVPNRALSSTKHIGNVQVRVFLPGMKEPTKLPAMAVQQYTRLPDHRPPLRRDKPVRISLPDNPPRYIFPALERSFIFIPRAMRPNQQGFGSRSRGRSGLGSISGFSRRTSMYGGSIYGSNYSPSVAMSRRSSLAYEVNRDALISPAGSTMSRSHIPMDNSKPVVRLPPASQDSRPQSTQLSVNGDHQSAQGEYFENMPRPQTYPLPQKPTFRENRQNAIPMHQPRPQKSVSVADIESPVNLSFNPPQQYQQPFHQQVPAQVNGNGYAQDGHLNPHSRNASYPSQASTGTPLSQIPERAIHAQPFQPNPYQAQQNYYPPQQYPVMPTQQGYYYPQQYSSQMAPQAAPFAPAAQQTSYTQPSTHDSGAASAPPNLVAQEVNGMVYYYDAAQIPAVATFPAYPPPQQYPMQQVGGVVGMGGMMTPSPDGFYYPQAQQGVVYFQQ